MRLTVVTDRPSLIYSGMIPGVVAEEYGAREAVVDSVGLARRAGARCSVQPAVAIDAERRRVRLADGTVVGYDVASLDVGATVRGSDRLGPPEGTVSPRDVDTLAVRLRALEAGLRAPSVVVVGGGAAGVELAAVIRARLGRRFRFEDGSREGASVDAASVTLVEGAPRIMDGYRETVSRRVRRALEERGVTVRVGDVVERIDAAKGEPGTAEHDSGTVEHDPEAAEEPATLVLSSGHHLTSHLTIWATGAAAHPLLRTSGLPTDEDGFVVIDDHLLVRGRDDLFAVGDCARFGSRDLPKAGVHAVRQAPVLFENLRRRAGDRARSLRTYEPQKNFLTLLNLGDGTALGTKWGLVVGGRWVRWLKDAIDRRFVEGFRDPG